MILSDFYYYSQWVFLLYFLGLSGGYLILNFNAMISIYHYMNERSIDEISSVSLDILPPISLIVPAYNEESTIIDSIRALLQLNYPEYEIIIVNDGSSDNTLEVIKQTFEFTEFPEAYRNRLTSKPIVSFFQSKSNSKIRLINKENGGKADSINAGINASRYPLFCTIDADSILQHNSLQKIVKPFVEDSTTVASGGTVRVVNGCKVKRGFLFKAGLPKNFLALVQVVEYLRAFLFGRLGWSPMNALLIISGAFGLFRKETVIEAGGYYTDTIGEDMELVVRLHKMLKTKKIPYRITFVPDPICWTEAPESLRVLASQRMRWQRGLSESLFTNFSMLFNPRMGTVGMVAFPFFLLFEWLGPVIEVFGYLILVIGLSLGYIDLYVFIVLMSVAVGFGILLSVSALLMEEASFHIYQRPLDLLILFLVVLVENLGYRQLTTIWRVIGMYQWLFSTKHNWGEMTRKGGWKE